MGTRRVQRNTSAPSTEFYTDADLISQNQAGNYSTVHYYVGAINRGNTDSYSNASGHHVAWVGGQGGNGYGGTIPIGYATGAQRWYIGPWGVNLPHDAAGNRGADQVQQQVQWLPDGWNYNDYGSIGPYPRIPKRPDPPGTPVASAILPTSLTLSWTASPNNQGSAIDGYMVRRWTGTTPTGPYVDHTANNISRSITGLTPGTDYTFGVYAHNGSADNGGYSNLSNTLTVKTLAPVRVKVAGLWKYAIPYVKIGGEWKVALPYVKVAGIWKQTT